MPFKDIESFSGNSHLFLADKEIMSRINSCTTE